MLRYILSSLLVYAISQASASARQDSVVVYPNHWFNGVFVDVDLVEPIVSLSSDDHKGFNASAAIDLKHRILPNFQVGYAEYDASSNYSGYEQQPGSYLYKVKGPYFKIGLDFNLSKPKKIVKRFVPIGYLGIRFAFSKYDYEISDVNVGQSDWGAYDKIESSSSTFAKWGEFVGGVRVPVLNRVYLGVEGCYKWSFKADAKHFDIAEGREIKINQTYAPGYGNDCGSTWGIRYVVSVFF